MSERLEVLRDVPCSEYGGCSFCTERPDTVTLVGGVHPMRHGSFRLCQDCLSELRTKIAVPEPKTPDPGKAARRVFQCIVGSGVLRDKSAEELVGLAIEHLRPSGDMGMLILHEMCTRVHPDWAKDEDSGT